VKDYRKELDSNIWLMPPLYHRVWQWIKYSVNHRPRKVPFRDGTSKIVGPGERITSYRQIAKGVGYYERGIWREPNAKTIKDILDWMETEQMIAVESNSKYTLIKVLNWGIYQDDDGGKSNSQETVRKQSLDTNKNDKNEKNDKKNRDHLSKHDVFDYRDVLDLYHDLCPSLPRVLKLNTNRKTLIRARHKEYGLDGLATLFAKAEASDFLTGRTGRWKGANLDWLLKDSNCLKVLEGNYDNAAPTKPITSKDFSYSEPSQQDTNFFTFLGDGNG